MHVSALFSRGNSLRGRLSRWRLFPQTGNGIRAKRAGRKFGIEADCEPMITVTEVGMGKLWPTHYTIRWRIIWFLIRFQERANPISISQPIVGGVQRGKVRFYQGKLPFEITKYSETINEWKEEGLTVPDNGISSF